MKINRYYLYSLGVIVATVAGLISYGQPLIAASGEILLWSSDNAGADTSQHISDWYSFSHFLHGIIFFFLVTFIFKKLKKEIDYSKIFFVSVLVESFWELLENTPMIINRYREGALAAGYFGDSVLNSTFDILFMCAGFIFAKKIGWKISLVTLIFIELFTLYFIRDNLTLNIIMLLHPFEAISAWQTSL